MNIIIRNTGEMPIYEQIVSQIKSAIISGEMGESEPLPSIRQLARELRISVITTKRAYEELEREGFIVTMSGKGSFVASRNMELIREEQHRQMEQALTAAVSAAKKAGEGKEELAGLKGREDEEEGGEGAGSTRCSAYIHEVVYTNLRVQESA